MLSSQFKCWFIAIVLLVALFGCTPRYDTTPTGEQLAKLSPVIKVLKVLTYIMDAEMDAGWGLLETLGTQYDVDVTTPSKAVLADATLALSAFQTLFARIKRAEAGARGLPENDYQEAQELLEHLQKQP